MPEWTRSSFCGGGQCVEVMFFPDGSVGLRHSARPDKVAHFTAAEWDAFVKGVRSGDFADIGASPGA